MSGLEAVAERSFRLSEDFVGRWRRRPVGWGFDIGGGNTLGELVFLSRYSRLTAAGRKETWSDCVRRVVEGTFSVLEDHCARAGRPWDREWCTAAAERMYAGMFEMRWLPPGRGIWMMGTSFMAEEGGAALQNCAFVSTRALGRAQTWEPFVRLMEMSMLGIGVGFDTRGRDRLLVRSPPSATRPYRIADSREGWSESVRRLLSAYFCPGAPIPVFDYGLIRPAGRPIVRFGGTSGGEGPLRTLHTGITRLLNGRSGQRLSSTDIVDLMNMIGICVAGGNIGRSAEIALGSADDPAFVDLKNPAVNPERLGPGGWGHISNNTVITEPGDDCAPFLERIAENGEPGLFFLSTARSHGRLADPPDHRDAAALGTNPCAEQTLEDLECCTLVETFPTRHRPSDRFADTLWSALLYAKAVTLVPTQWRETNAVMGRNRRIGCSMSGLAQFVERHGYQRLIEFLDEGYTVARDIDRRLSSWLAVPQSVKLTSVKPSGTVSLLAGVSPGVHFPEGASDHGAYIRRLRCPRNGPLAPALADAGYTLEVDLTDSSRVVAELPIAGQAGRVATQVSADEKIRLAAAAQRHWADNQVSVTLTFREAEAPELKELIAQASTRLKSISFLPMVAGGAYAQMPYEPVTAATFDRLRERVRPLDWHLLYEEPVQPEGERFCSSDRCEWLPPEEEKRAP